HKLLCPLFKIVLGSELRSSPVCSKHSCPTSPLFTLLIILLMFILDAKTFCQFGAGVRTELLFFAFYPEIRTMLISEDTVKMDTATTDV
ncbi:hypothetical protein ACQP3D_27110, partial [Escherichia coli]